MDTERLKKAGATVIALLVGIGSVFAFREDAGQDVENILETIGDNPIPAVLLAFALCLACFVWWEAIVGLFGYHSMRATKEKLQKWCLRNGYTIQDTGPHSDLDFRFVIRDVQDIPIHVIKRKEDSVLRLVVGIKVDPKLANTLKSAKQPLLSDSISAMRIEMARNGIRYTGLVHPLDEVTLSNRIPLDLNEYALTEEIGSMTNAHVLFLESLHRAVVDAAVEQGQAVPPPPDTEGSGEDEVTP